MIIFPKLALLVLCLKSENASYHVTWCCKGNQGCYYVENFYLLRKGKKSKTPFKVDCDSITLQRASFWYFMVTTTCGLWVLFSDLYKITIILELSTWMINEKKLMCNIFQCQCINTCADSVATPSISKTDVKLFNNNDWIMTTKDN